MENKNTKKVLEKIKNFPKSSGVYFFYHKKKIIYIGKATFLKSRISSYFSPDIESKRGPLIKKMTEIADDVDFKITENSIEALILEANLIKKNQPKYNTKEKSDKSFCYLIITKEKFPKIFIKRQKDFLEKKIPEKIKYNFGPFSSKKNLEEVLKILRKIFPYYQRKNSYNEKSALYQQIGLLPYLGISEKEYRENIENIKSFFEGKKKKIIKNLEKKMLESAKKMDFETAQKYKKKFISLKNISDSSFLEEEEKFFKEKFLVEAFDVAHLQGKNSVGVMVVLENGEAQKNLYKKFNIKSFEGIDDNKALQEILKRRLEHKEWNLPNLIVADGGIAQKRSVEKVLKEMKMEEKIKVVSVVKDKNHKPKAILGKKDLIEKYKKEILLSNYEAHRFSISQHIKKRNKNFLKK